MTVATSAPRIEGHGAIPMPLLNAAFVLLVVNASFFLALCISHSWIFDEQGRVIPTDFINVWSAGKLALDGRPGLAWDWDIQKQLQVAVLGRNYVGNFAWHYPPPFLFIASLLAHFPYAVAFIGWAATSLMPYLAVMRAIVGRRFGLLLAAAFPAIVANAMVGQNGGSEQLAWALQCAMTSTVAVVTVLLWRSRARYSLKAAALATGTLLMTPYLFLYDMMVLAIPIALLVRIGLADGFQKYELLALACAMLLLLSFPFFEAPVGFGSTLIVAALIARRLPVFRRKGPHVVVSIRRDLGASRSLETVSSAR